MKASVSTLIFLGTASLFQLHAAIQFDGEYSQDFDSLGIHSGSGSTAYSWSDDQTLAGWYLGGTPGSYRANHGNSTAADYYSFGPDGSSDRALGSVAGSGSEMIWGAHFQNATDQTIEGLSVRFAGEEWRKGDTQNTLFFEYFIGNPAAVDSKESGWTTVNELDFSTPQSGGASPFNLDGNLSANGLKLDFSLTGVSIGQGEDFWIRWRDVDDSGSDAGVGVDDLAISAVPEPSATALAAAGFLSALVLIRRCRRWRSARV